MDGAILVCVCAFGLCVYAFVVSNCISIDGYFASYMSIYSCLPCCRGPITQLKAGAYLQYNHGILHSFEQWTARDDVTNASAS